MMQCRVLRIFSCLGLLASVTMGLRAHHNGTRYFPLLEKTEDIITKKHSHIAPEFFYLMASTAHRHGGGAGGIPELWGQYDLKDIFTSLREVQGVGVADPIKNMLSPDVRDLSMPFKVDGHIHAQGLALGYEQALKEGFSIGIWAPVMHVSATSYFNLTVNSAGSLNGLNRPLATNNDGDWILNAEGRLLDAVRRATHNAMGFVGDYWDASGVGDIDVHLKWNYFIDHQWLMRSIDNYIQVGVIIPTGMTTKVGEPLSLPAMGNGHWGAYFDVMPEFELKQDWKFGFLFGGLYQFKETKNRRISVGNEPAPYSALTGRVEVQPGVTAKLSPYFTLENLTDGVHFQIRYTYLRHNIDKWYDHRDAQTQQAYPSYLTSGTNIAQHEQMSKWRSHFFSFQLMYDAKQAMQNWGMEPLLHVTYDLPISGNGIAKTHQISVGAKLHF